MTSAAHLKLEKCLEHSECLHSPSLEAHALASRRLGGETIAVQSKRESFNLNLDSSHQAGQVRNKERYTGGHREPQADVEQQGWKTPPHKPGPPAGLGEGLERALKVGGPGRRPGEKVRDTKLYIILLRDTVQC